MAGDARGSFVKMQQRSWFDACGLESDFRESYFSVSHDRVIRGMHFQAPPHDHAKLITVVQGKIVDVVLDLRRSSPTYGQHCAIELSAADGLSLYVSRGLAHGFAVLEGDATVNYLVTTEYAPDQDMGVRYDSFGYCWPVTDPILSGRDRALPPFSRFTTPFS
ncbi:MAG: dTDP-4-dehydrorhamnose 3,5-epimerase [Magnetococcus sp. WYHC-3]